MLISIISSSAISSSAISAVAMTTTPGLLQYGSSVVAGLVMLLSLKEVLSSSERWNKNLNASFTMVILPLILSFVAIVAYKVDTII